MVIEWSFWGDHLILATDHGKHLVHNETGSMNVVNVVNVGGLEAWGEIASAAPRNDGGNGRG